MAGAAVLLTTKGATLLALTPELFATLKVTCIVYGPGRASGGI
jgi:hypothetical protein